MSIEFGWITTKEATERTGISALDLHRHAMDERLHPMLIENEDLWSIEELDRLIERIRDSEDDQ